MTDGSGPRAVPRRAIDVALAVAAALVLVLIARNSLVSSVAAVDPHLALAIAGDDPTAAVAIINDQVATLDAPGAPAPGSPAPRDSENAAATAERLRAALRAEPAEPRTLELLGILAERSGNRGAAHQFMEAAARRSLRTPAAQFYLLRASLEAGDVPAAVRSADLVLRNRPAAMPIVGSILATIAMKGAGADILRDALARDPPWRAAFFRLMNNDSGFCDASVALLMALQNGPHPATAREIESALWALVAKAHYELAYYAWLHFLPASQAREARQLFNGDFVFPSGSSPFNWKLPGSEGAIAEFASVDAGDDRKILAIEIVGRAHFRPISQLLLLSPGNYLLSGSVKGDISGGRGFRWQIECVAPKVKTIAQTDLERGAILQWRSFATAFDVPGGCEAQSIKLMLDETDARDLVTSGAISFANLGITRR
jgi:hypothetical protein